MANRAHIENQTRKFDQIKEYHFPKIKAKKYYMKNKEIDMRILSALEQSNYKWRTARGLAKETSIPIQKVHEFLENSPKILRAKKSNKHGKALYTTRDKYRNTTPISKRILAILRNEAY